MNKLMLSLFMLVSLSACQLLPTTGEHASVHLHAANYLNPDINGRASPLVISIYQLKNLDRFRQANFRELNEQSNQVLAGDLLDKDIVIMRPSEQQRTRLNLNKQTRYLGFVAAYQNINKAVWKRVVRVHKHQLVNLELAAEGISIS